MKLFLALFRIRMLEIRLHDAQNAVEELGAAQQSAYLVVRDLAGKLDEARAEYQKLTNQGVTAS